MSIARGLWRRGACGLAGAAIVLSVQPLWAAEPQPVAEGRAPVWSADGRTVVYFAHTNKPLEPEATLSARAPGSEEVEVLAQNALPPPDFGSAMRRAGATGYVWVQRHQIERKGNSLRARGGALFGFGLSRPSDQPLAAFDGYFIGEFAADRVGARAAFLGPKEGGGQRRVKVKRRVPGYGVEQFLAGKKPEWVEEDVLRPYDAVWLVDLKTGELTQLTHEPGRSEAGLDLSADGRWLAYVTAVPLEASERSRYRTHNFTIHKMDLEAKQATQLTDGAHDVRPKWSPDATRLAYGHHGAIWVMNADGSDPREIKGKAVVPPSLWFLEWTPDGRYVLFHSRGDLYAVEVETRALVALSRGAQLQDDRTVRLSPDGQRVLFCKGEQIYVLELDWSPAPSGPEPD